MNGIRYERGADASKEIYLRVVGPANFFFSKRLFEIAVALMNA